MPTTDKEKINDWILTLKRKGVIRYHADVARALKYKAGTISGMLKKEGGKPVSPAFMEKFKKEYGLYLNDVENPESLEERIMKLETEVRILKKQMRMLAREKAQKS